MIDTAPMTDELLGDAIALLYEWHERIKFSEPARARAVWKEYLALVSEQMDRKGRKAA